MRSVTYGQAPRYVVVGEQFPVAVTGGPGGSRPGEGRVAADDVARGHPWPGIPRG